MVFISNINFLILYLTVSDHRSILMLLLAVVLSFRNDLQSYHDIRFLLMLASLIGVHCERRFINL